jgi:hypothetical protein
VGGLPLGIELASPLLADIAPTQTWRCIAFTIAVMLMHGVQVRPITRTLHVGDMAPVTLATPCTAACTNRLARCLACNMGQAL